MNTAAHLSPAPLTPEHRPLGVLAGFDGSEQGRLALHYAARAAQRRGAPLSVVTAYTVPVQAYSTLAAIPSEEEMLEPQRRAESVLEQAREYLADYPGKVSYEVQQGDAAGVLVGLSARAALLVVGGRGRGGFVGRLLGSVSSAAPAHAACPTVVVPKAYDPESTITADGARFAPVQDDRPVTVGVDGSEHSRLAALQAADAATGRSVPLRLVMALPPLEDVTHWYPDVVPDHRTLTERRRNELQGRLDEELSWLRSRVPELEVTGSVTVGTAAEVLRRASEEDQLTVVGTRGRGGMMSALLGSVSRQVLVEAAGPVMVVPQIPDPRLDA